MPTPGKTKKVQIPIEIFHKIIAFMECCDISGCEPGFQKLYRDIFSCLIDKRDSMELRESYARVVFAEDEAMTYDTYASRFSALVENHFRPALIASDDKECRIYGQLLYENKLGLHALRHWYSVQMILNGEDIAQIQYWRGDTNPESALLYLQDKGDLVRELESAGNIFAEMLMKNGEMEVGTFDGA